MSRIIAFIAVIAAFGASPPQVVAGGGANDFASYSWTRMYGDNPGAGSDARACRPSNCAITST